MNTNNKVKLFGAIIGIVMFIVLIAGISYAWITWNSSNVAISGSTECVDMNYTAGQDIVDANVLLFDESKIIQDNKITIKKGMAITNVIASAKDGCTINEVNLGIGLDATSISDSYFDGDSVGAFKYAIAKYDHNTYTDVSADALEGLSFELIEHGSVTKSGESVLTNDIPLSSKEVGLLVIFYIDGYLAGNSIGNSTFSGSILGMVMQVEPSKPMEIGDYVSYTPIVSSYETEEKYTGTSTQTIYPNELILWRVLNKNADGSVDIISEYVSSTEVDFFGQTGYLNYVGYLNVLAEQYETLGITSGSRYFGYNEQTEYLNINFSYNAPFTSSTTDNSNESAGGGDILYEKDYNQLQTALGTRLAYMVGTTKTTSYLIASRHYDYSSSAFYYRVRKMNISGNIKNEILTFYHVDLDMYLVEKTYGSLRPIVTLKPGLRYIGEGTSGSPWKIVD